ncbi:Adenylate cyclase 1 [Caulifigura coniformis]|uniref:Adenylate cyclase 1 n=1 Tax=Caulifigura coniformis TaxID=2527983 RepID=A0A517S8T9_9PLAN|nr:adenylate/guanylate cyclase domain-containing protein [Caulifigura coniformis]QDT52522.1 Adenylate cyclase 1 [Caulifigura coniformis]
MWQLVAHGPNPSQRLRQALEPGKTLRLGRSPEVDLPIPWEPVLSRDHLTINVGTASLKLHKRPSAANPVFMNGRPVEEAVLTAGDTFVIGETTFHVGQADVPSPTPADLPVEEVIFSRQDLRRIQYRDADKRMDVLSSLPELISGSHNESALWSRLSHLLLTGIRNAEAVAVVELNDEGKVGIRHWERRRETSGSFRPSHRLIVEALTQQRSALHAWQRRNPSTEDYTVSSDSDWAFCTPIEGQPVRRGLYVAGQIDQMHSIAESLRPEGMHLQADVKFTELVADVIGSVERVNRLESNLSVLRQFLSPPVLQALERSDTGGLNVDLLEPRECHVTVLFCDVRGFSQRAEEAAGDLKSLLNELRMALELMTQEILHHGGVTGEFLGDAALGFWGWPFGSEEAPLNACRAALGIRRRLSALRQDPDHPLADVDVGIGIAQGPAVAGKIGTSDRMTVTVFGPVVNLASRLETMTKQLRVPILLDEATADVVRRRLSTTEGRLRKLARVQPYGMETPLTVSELLLPMSGGEELTDAHLELYEQGVEHFLAGRWQEAYRCLHAMPSSDRAPDFLLPRLAQHNRHAPPGWTGVIELPEK